MQKVHQVDERDLNETSQGAGLIPVMNAFGGLISRGSAGEFLSIIVMPAILASLLFINKEVILDLIQFLPALAGFVYDEDYLEGGVYYHHDGSSTSSPRGANSWIGAIKKAFGVDYLTCCVSGCDEEAECGAHLTESRIMEILSLFGLGGTPVVPTCFHHHGTGPVEIDGTDCIYDMDCPIDIQLGKQSLSNVRCANECCGAFTIGPNFDDEYWCPECEHIVDDDGDCITEGCSSDGCDDDEGW
mgnify:CR=1 FL=1|jgi:hypothetical protein|tara:strand:+ start:2624 stop:3355 length:732 start_codon:yes stop_codon:yes gene_type:complete